MHRLSRSFCAAAFALAASASLTGRAKAQSVTLLKAGRVDPAAPVHPGSTTTVGTGETIDWTVSYSNNTSGPAQVDVVDPVPNGTQYVAGSLQAPPDFVRQWSKDGGATWLNAEPVPASSVTNVRALIASPNLGAIGPGRALPIPVPPSGAFSTAGGGGDGYRAIPYANKIWLVNHHTGLNYLDCFDASTGVRCAGFPYNVPDTAGAAFQNSLSLTSTPGKPLEYIDRATGRLYFPASRNDPAAPSQSQWGILCADLVNSVSCGFTNLFSSTDARADFPGFTGMGSGSGRIYIGLYTGQIGCMTLATQAPCVGQPFTGGSVTLTRVGFPSQVYSLLTLPEGNRLFTTWPGGSPTTPGSALLTCWDTATNTACSGWPLTPITGSTHGQLYPMLDGTTGAPTGLCYQTNNGGAPAQACFTTAGAGTAVPPAFATFMTTYQGGVFNDVNYSFGDAGVFGTRIFQSGLSNVVGIGCFDWATGAPCTGAFPRTGATVTNFYYSTIADATRFGCMWYDGDDGLLGSFAASDGGSCSVRTALDGTVTPAQFYCGPSAGAATAWAQIALSGLTSSDFAAATVTIADPGTGLPITVGATTYLNLPVASFPLDLSGIPYATYPSLHITLAFSGIVSNTPWASGTPVGLVSWTGSLIQACFQTQVTNCATPAIQNSVTTTTMPVGSSAILSSANSNTLAHQIAPSCAPAGTLTLVKEVCSDPNPANCTAISTNWAAAQTLPAGTTVSWRITVRNTSAAVDVQTVTVADPLVAACGVSFGTVPVIAAGGSAVAVCTTPALLSSLTNVAQASGTAVATGSAPGAAGTPVATGPGSATASITPLADVTTTVSLPPPSAGQTGATATATFGNVNTAPSPATGVVYSLNTVPGTVTGMVCGGQPASLAGSTLTGAGLPATLNPGQLVSCTVTYNASNSGSVTLSSAIDTATDEDPSAPGVNHPGPLPNAATVTQPVSPLTPVAVAKAFAPVTISTGQSSLLIITLSNPNGTAVTAVTFTDAYPPGLVNTATPAAATTCGGVVTAAPGGSSLALTGGVIPANGSCTVSAFVTSGVVATYPNNTGSVATANAGTSPGASSTLNVVAAGAAIDVPALSEGSVTLLAGLLGLLGLMLLRHRPS